MQRKHSLYPGRKMMKLEKILEALSRTDKLGTTVINGCAVGQLFLARGKTKCEIKNECWLSFGWPEAESGMPGDRYSGFFGGLLAEEYDMTTDEIVEMHNLNDVYKTFRHKRVLAHYEGLLIEELIAESAQGVLVEA